ncbi:hypothetical protein QA596_00130 [Balneolales bacterium ANBcel1]|nr:hypothetical protein [Balneolales bacterium ANBcel1]
MRSLQAVFRSAFRGPSAYSRNHPPIPVSRFSAAPVWLLVLLTGTLLLVSSCASTDELKDDELEQLLDQAEREYGDLAELLDEMAIVEETLDEESMEAIEARAEELLAELPELSIDLASYRSRLADQQQTVRNQVPEIYMEEIREQEQRATNQGFRIQIISTRDARLAEEIREDFESWISSVSAPPHARTYMVFQQPYYRVHVGDFLNRDHAMEFTEFVRLRYPDAWVVHSRIQPGRVMR